MLNITRIVSWVISILALAWTACQPKSPVISTSKLEPSPTPSSISNPTPTTSPTDSYTPVPSPTRENPTLDFWKNFYTPDFTAVHLPLDNIPNEFLIFGNQPVSPPAADLPPGLENFLGRWEGLEYTIFGETGTRLVMVVTDISQRAGTAYLWAGADLQYPFYVKEIHFQVVPGEKPSIEWSGDLSGSPGAKDVQGAIALTYDPETDHLEGTVRIPPSQEVVRTLQLAHGDVYHYFRNYPAYLESQRITFHAFTTAPQQRVGRGYALYLPEGYETDVQKTWPLIVFLIGTGERGQSLSLLTKHGPLRTILDGQPLPFIIASPMLEVSRDFRSFPEDYLDVLMEDILADYRVDTGRIYLTGLSMGGEATYRYALHRPDLFAALAPMSAFDPKYLPGSAMEGFKPFTQPYNRIADIPVWAVHGKEDPIVPLSAAQQTVDALISAGGLVQFTVIEGGGHNIWTEFYSDRAFYDWLLNHKKE